MNSAKRVMQLYRNKVVRISLRTQLLVMFAFLLMGMLRTQIVSIAVTLDLPYVTQFAESKLFGKMFGSSGIFWAMVQAVLFLFSLSAIATIATRVAYGFSVLFQWLGHLRSRLLYKILLKENCPIGRIFINLKEKRQEFQVYLQ